MRSLPRLIGLTALFPLIAHAQTPPPLLARPPEPPTHTVTVDSEEFRKIALSHPAPQYPIEARRRHITGKGRYHLHVSLDTGEVTSVDVLTTTGHRILDRAAIAALKRWKFRPRALIGVKVPITFSMPSKT